MIYPFIIIGASAAGMGAIIRLRQLTDAPILCITQEQELPYNKCLLTQYIADPHQLPSLYLKPTAWFAEQGIELLLNTRVTALDVQNNCLEIQQGDKKSYVTYRALLLAVGCDPVVPVPWQEAVIPFHGLSDAQRIIQQIHSGSSVVVIGAGINGLECAEVLCKKGVTVTVIDRADTLMPAWPRPAADFLTTHIKKHGVRLVTNALVEKITGQQGQWSVAAAQETFHANFIIGAMGVKPATTFMAQAGLIFEQGFIVVDEYLQTSMPNIFAAGDSILINNQQLKDKPYQWHMAVAQGVAAAQNMVTAQAKAYQFIEPLIQTTLFGMPIAYSGNIVQATESRISQTLATFKYYSFNHNNQLQGFAMMGQESSVIRSAYKELQKYRI